MNNANEWKGYSWDDSIEIVLSNWVRFKMKLSDNKSATYMWYICQSCLWETTLAEWNCGSCANPFEPRDIKEAKSLFPEVKVQIEDPNRLAWYMNHRSWLCLQCDSYNANLPRNNTHSEETSCINCWHQYESGFDLLFEDALANDPDSSTQKFKDSILSIIETHRNPPKPQNRDTRKWWVKDKSKEKTTSDRNRLSSPLWRNKWKIFLGVFWVAGLWYLIHYWFIEKVNYDLRIIGHQWTSTQYLEKYQQQTDDGWERDISSGDYNDFKLVRKTQKEASWDPYTATVGTREVTDYDNCLKYDTPEEICTTPTEQCDYATVNGITVKGNCSTPEASCHTPAKTCEAYWTKPENITEIRYHEHPYIYFSYMNWETISNALIKTWGLNNQIGWENSSLYPNIEDNKLFRYQQEPIDYKIIFKFEWTGKDSISLPQETWKDIESWVECAIEWTRWWWINTNDFLLNIQNCKS